MTPTAMDRPDTSRTGRAAFDARMMAIALGMRARGLGRTAFNPSVGAVIADEATGELIACGWTQPGGRPHAEKEALRRAGARARGKTMYVTLEPCAHTGRVPTCADAVLTAGLKRLVCAIADPNEIIAGRGFEQLREAGVEVEVGLMAAEARWITAGHILNALQKRPFVQLKLAVSADGRMRRGHRRGAGVGHGPAGARRYGHLAARAGRCDHRRRRHGPRRRSGPDLPAAWHGRPLAAARRARHAPAHTCDGTGDPRVRRP